MMRKSSADGGTVDGGGAAGRSAAAAGLAAAWTLAAGLVCAASGADWPQWGGSNSRNMVSAETGLPETLAPGAPDVRTGRVDPSTTTNVRWVARLGATTYTTPAVAGGRVFVGAGFADGQARMLCLDERTGRTLWQWKAPPRDVPKEIDGRKFWFSVFPRTLGICSTPTVDGDRLYFMSHRCEVVCLDVAGGPDAPPGAAGDEPPVRDARVLWTSDIWALGVRPSDACNGSVLVDGDLLYLCTNNGVDRDMHADKHDEFRQPPAPDAPSLVALDKRTGRVVAVDDAGIGPRLLHGQWSSPALGTAGGRKLVVFGGGDGVCYAFAALASVPPERVKLETVWTFDAVPPEYKVFGDMDRATHYCRGDLRRSDALNKSNDGTFAGMSEIIATPVFLDGRVYVAIGRDPEHGRGRGALHCIAADGRGDLTKSGRVWTYQGLDRTLSTVSVAGGLLYISDVAGRLHALDARTGECLWIHEAHSRTLGSTLVADGRVYMSTDKGLWILAAGREKKILGRVELDGPLWATPVAANGTLFLTSKTRMWAADVRFAGGVAR